LNKINLTVFFILFTQACSANTSELSEKAYLLASNNFLQAKNKYESKVNECNQKKKIIVSPEFQNIELTKEEQVLALVILNNRAESLCESNEAGEFSIASSIFRTTAKHYNKNTSIADNYTEDLTYGHYWRNLQLETKYLEIPEKKRLLIENIEAFKQPFFPLKTLSKLHP